MSKKREFTRIINDIITSEYLLMLTEVKNY